MYYMKIFVNIFGKLRFWVGLFTNYGCSEKPYLLGLSLQHQVFDTCLLIICFTRKVTEDTIFVPCGTPIKSEHEDDRYQEDDSLRYDSDIFQREIGDQQL